MKSISEALTWRYATKQFDTTKKLAEEEIMALLDYARLSPSWYGLQPWKFILVENPAVRAKLREASYGQPQVTEASHFVVFTHKTSIDEAYVDAFIASSAKAEGVTIESLKPLKDGVMGFVTMIQGNASAWAANQVHIPLGIFVESAALLGYDACPMGGFDPAKYDEILGLKEEGLRAVAVCAVGYRNESDPAAKRAKSRFSLDEVVIRK